MGSAAAGLDPNPLRPPPSCIPSRCALRLLRLCASNAVPAPGESDRVPEPRLAPGADAGASESGRRRQPAAARQESSTALFFKFEQRRSRQAEPSRVTPTRVGLSAGLPAQHPVPADSDSAHTAPSAPTDESGEILRGAGWASRSGLPTRFPRHAVKSCALPAPPSRVPHGLRDGPVLLPPWHLRGLHDARPQARNR